MSQSLSHGSVFVGRRQEMAELTAALDDSMSGQDSAWLADAIHTQTESNPLFVTEVVRLSRRPLVIRQPVRN